MCLPTFIISLALLFHLSLMQCQAFVTSMSRGVYHPNQTIIFDELTFKNPRLLYALCDTSNKCRLEHDREPFQRPTDTCQVTLEADSTIDKIRIVPFRNDKAIIIWMEKTENETYFNLLGVRFSDCWLLKVRSSFDYNKNIDFTFQPSLATYNNSYDVVFVNSKICGDKYCKMTVNFETNKVQGPTAWTPVNYDLLIADVVPLGSTDKGLLIVQFSGEVSIINGDDRKILKQSEAQSNTSSAALSYSISNNLIGTCELKNNTLKCSQFNHLGVNTFESITPIDSTYAPKATYNLPHGGILVLLNKHNTDFQRVLKINTNGMQTRLDVRIRCIDPRAAQFFEKNDRYCVSLACFNNDNYNNNYLQVAARCFSLNDISTF